MRYIFDTSFLISLIHLDDINHEKSLERITDMTVGVEDSFYINELILSETYTVLASKVNFDKIAILDSFLDQIQCQYLSGNFEEYFSFFKTNTGEISVADSSVIVDAAKYSFSILAFDKKLLQISEKILQP